MQQAKPRELDWRRPSPAHILARGIFEFMRPFTGVGIGVALLLYSFHFFGKTIEDRIGLVFVSCLGWAIAYFVILIPFFLVFKVPPDKLWIMENPFVPESKRLSLPSLGFRKIRAQKAYSAGYHWKFIWEGFAGELDLAHKITVENKKKNTTYTFKDGKGTIEIEWRVRSAVHPMFGVNRKRTSEEDVAQWLENRVDNFVAEYIGNVRKVDWGPKEEAKFRRAYEKQFGGPWYIDDEEFAYGTLTLTPEIIKMRLPKEQEEAQNFALAYKAVVDAARKEAKESNGEISFQSAKTEALTMWTLQNLKGGVDPVLILGGLLNKDLRPRENANAGQGGGGGGKRKKK